jgi:cytochrome b involved in lipid metabolism
VTGASNSYGQPANSYGQPANSYGQPANSYGIRPVANATAQIPQANNLRPIRNWELAEHNTSDSLWIGYKGYVYDATTYRHSGGLSAILRGAGKDATKMITIQHSWVKVDQVLKSTRIGILADQAPDSDDDD